KDHELTELNNRDLEVSIDCKLGSGFFADVFKGHLTLNNELLSDAREDLRRHYLAFADKIYVAAKVLRSVNEEGV
ncbi:hypothetical protein AAVH_23334, partial [Aphelenchoides avenae]